MVLQWKINHNWGTFHHISLLSTKSLSLTILIFLSRVKHFDTREYMSISPNLVWQWSRLSCSGWKASNIEKNKQKLPQTLPTHHSIDRLSSSLNLHPKGRLGLPKWMSFRKCSKRPLTPLPRVGQSWKLRKSESCPKIKPYAKLCKKIVLYMKILSIFERQNFYFF